MMKSPPSIPSCEPWPWCSWSKESQDYTCQPWPQCIDSWGGQKMRKSQDYEAPLPPSTNPCEPWPGCMTPRLGKMGKSQDYETSWCQPWPRCKGDFWTRDQ